MERVTIKLGDKNIPLRFGMLCIERFLTINDGETSVTRCFANLIYSAMTNEEEISGIYLEINYGYILGGVEEMLIENEAELIRIEKLFEESKTYKKVLANLADTKEKKSPLKKSLKPTTATI